MLFFRVTLAAFLLSSCVSAIPVPSGFYDPIAGTIDPKLLTLPAVQKSPVLAASASGSSSRKESKQPYALDNDGPSHRASKRKERPGSASPSLSQSPTAKAIKLLSQKQGSSAKERIPCKEGCGKTFTIKDNMERHARSHDPAKVLRCDKPDCSYSTNRSDHLRSHQRAGKHQRSSHLHTLLPAVPSSSDKQSASSSKGPKK
ncbi:hypothetical protein C8J56DRAFT_971010 [Mycena floridula]|nr:hypothetical protein C8J56DRAFT_971010 [Mycena floridula]